jgi:flagellar biosynthesis/type III secretory pathway protein FliH
MEGRKGGIEEGRKEGWKEGRKEGREEGRLYPYYMSPSLFISAWLVRPYQLQESTWQSPSAQHTAAAATHSQSWSEHL